MINILTLQHDCPNARSPCGCQCSTFCWHVKYKCQPTHSPSDTTARRPALPTQLQTTGTEHTHYLHVRLTITHIMTTHTGYRHHTRITTRTQVQLLVRAHNELLPNGLPKRAYDWWAGPWHGTSASQRENTQLTSADADVCIDRNLSSTLQTITTTFVHIARFIKLAPVPPKVHCNRSKDKCLTNRKHHTES